MKKNPDAKARIMMVVKVAEQKGALEELATYLNYFACAKRLEELADGDETRLRVLEMIAR